MVDPAEGKALQHAHFCVLSTAPSSFARPQVVEHKPKQTVSRSIAPSRSVPRSSLLTKRNPCCNHTSNRSLARHDDDLPTGCVGTDYNNRVLTMREGAMDLDTVCFGSCSTTCGRAKEEGTVDVTFQVLIPANEVSVR